MCVVPRGFDSLARINVARGDDAPSLDDYSDNVPAPKNDAIADVCFFVFLIMVFLFEIKKKKYFIF